MSFAFDQSDEIREQRKQIAALTAERERLAEERDRLRNALLAVIEDAGGACPMWECAKCVGHEEHTPDCIVGMALEAK